jgi:hypothetical protein
VNPSGAAHLSRAARVQQASRRKVRAGATRGLWQTWSARNASYLTGVYLTVSVLLCATTIVTGAPLADLQMLAHPILAYAPVAWFPFGAWLGDRWLALHTPPGRRVRSLARMLRAVAAGLPVVNIYVVAVWRHLLLHHAARVTVADQRFGLGPLFAAPCRRPRAVRLVPGQAGIWLASTVLGLVPLIAWTLALARAQPSWRFALACALQLGAAGAFAHAQWPAHGEAARGRLVVRLVAVCLVPLAGLFRGLPGDPLSDRRTRCLTWSVYARGSVERLRAWDWVARALRRRARRAAWWRHARREGTLPGDPRAGAVLHRVVTLARLKALALAGEAGAVAALVAHSAVGSPWIERGGGLLVAGATVVGAVGVVGRSMLFVRRLLRLPPGRGPAQRRLWSRFAVLVPLVLVSALLSGFALARGQALYAALGLTWGTTLLGMLAGIGITMTPSLAPDRVFDMAGRSAWSVVFMLFGFAAALLAAATHQTGFVPGDFVLIASVAWLADVLAAAAYARDLLHPFRWQHMRDPRVPRHLRLRLALLAASAALPCGGVLVPLWFHLRPQPGEVPPEVAQATLRA